MQMHVILDENGNPASYATEAFEGSVLLDLPDAVVLVPNFLNSHSWNGAAWVRRPPEPEPEPEPVGDAVARLEAIEMEVVRLAGPDQLLRSMGKITIAELNARVAAIRERVEAGG